MIFQSAMNAKKLGGFNAIFVRYKYINAITAVIHIAENSFFKFSITKDREKEASIQRIKITLINLYFRLVNLILNFPLPLLLKIFFNPLKYAS